VRSPRSRGRARPRTPLLTPTQAREAAGVTLVAAGLLAILALLAGTGPGGIGVREAVFGLFGWGWPIPVAAALAAGAYLLWPHPIPVRGLDVLAAVLAAAAVLGLLSLAAGAGGGSGHAVAALLTAFVGRWGAAVVLLFALLLGLIVAFRFSPGAVMLAMGTALRAAHAERQRLEALVRPQKAAESRAVPAPVAPKPERPPAAAAVGAIPGPPAASTLVLDALAEDVPAADEVEDAQTAGAALPRPALRVVAEPIDDEPDIDWRLPTPALLDSVTARKERMQDEIKRNVRIIEQTLGTFGVQARVVGVNPGPAVTQYELQPAAGVQVKRITALQTDLSLALAASPLRIEAPIPGKSAVGIEVPNRSASLVALREVVESPAFASGSLNLALAVGNDVSGQPIVGDLTRMPHLLIAGATGQGKSVCINTLISSLLMQATPEQLRMILIDPKRVELSGYNGLPHLAVPVIVEPHQAAAALRWAVAEMDRRYKVLSSEGVRNIQGYNERARTNAARTLPYVVIVIDELADLMMVAAGEIEELVCRIAQLARAVGIHLVIATQRPSTDIITGLIKANIPSRIAFAVGSQVDSRVILDSGGAEKLLGRGDMLYQPVDAGKPTRIQGAFVSDAEVDGIVRFWKAQGEPRYMEEVLDDRATSDFGEPGSERRLDPLFARAARAVAAEGGASVSLVQRKFNVGYSRAGRIVDQLAEHRVIGAYQGSKSREVLMNLPDVDELLERLGLE
jgi:S-DNA-T family DNA segregation ATPase FtsK/SpoIIIE